MTVPIQRSSPMNCDKPAISHKGIIRDHTPIANPEPIASQSPSEAIVIAAEFRLVARRSLRLESSVIPCSSRRFLISLLLIPIFASSGAPFADDSVLVLRSGVERDPPSLTSNPATLVEYGPDGTVRQTIPLLLHLPADQPNDARLTTDADGHSITAAGFVPPFSGSGPLISRSFSDAPAAVVRIGADGIASQPDIRPLLQGVRGAIFNNDEIWAGRNLFPPLIYLGPSGEFSAVGSSGGTPRFVDGTSGISTGVSYFPGLQRSYVPFITLVSPSEAVSDSYVSLDKGLIYLATAPGNLIRYDLANGRFNLTRSFSKGDAFPLIGLAVDMSGEFPVVYTTSEGRLYRLVDDGNQTAMTPIASRIFGYAFFGVQIPPSQRPPAAPDVRPPALLLGGKSRTPTVRSRLNHVRFSGFVSDGEGPVRLQLRIPGRGGWKPIAIVNGTWARRIKLRNESRVIVKIRATDAAGNASTARRVIRHKS